VRSLRRLHVCGWNLVALATVTIACQARAVRAEVAARPPPTSSIGAEKPSLFLPRWTPIEIQIPDIVAGSVGLWVLAPAGIHHRIGLATDLGISLGGATLALGPGFLRPEFEDAAELARLARHEKGWSVAVQGLIHRTWPWWTPRLPTSTTYVGADISAGYLMCRCSLGVMRAIGDRENADWRLIGGIGIGLP
jgi:hypothetical protein